MNTTIILVACLVAIIIAIALNFTMQINMGIIAMAFAFIIGCLMSGLKAKDVFSFWPDNLIFFMIASALFYGFARENGTLQLFGNKVLYKFRNTTAVLPWVFFFIASLMGLLGAGPGTIVLLAPIGFVVANQIKMSPILLVFAIDSGYNCGTQNPWTGTGVVMYGLVEKNLGGDTALAFSSYFRSYIVFVLAKIIMLVVFYLFFAFLKRRQMRAENLKSSAVPSVDLQRHADKKSEFMTEKPGEYSRVQKMTLTLILVSFALMVIPNVINTLHPIENLTFQAVLNLCKPQAILIIFTMFACFLKLADSKKVFNKVPVNTILIIAGVAFLMEIAKMNGLIEMMTGMLGTGIPKLLVAPLFCFLGAIISLFASGTSVVLPLLFPMVPALVAATGLNPVAFYAAAQLGALSTPISPFSTAGAMFVSLAPNELSEKLVKQQFVTAMIMMVLAVLLTIMGLGYILKV